MMAIVIWLFIVLQFKLNCHMCIRGWWWNLFKIRLDIYIYIYIYIYWKLSLQFFHIAGALQQGFSQKAALKVKITVKVNVYVWCYRCLQHTTSTAIYTCLHIVPKYGFYSTFLSCNAWIPTVLVLIVVASGKRMYWITARPSTASWLRARAHHHRFANKLLSLEFANTHPVQGGPKMLLL